MKFKFSRKGKYIILPKQFAHHGFEVEDCTVSEGGTSNIRAYFSYLTELETIAEYIVASYREIRKSSEMLQRASKNMRVVFAGDTRNLKFMRLIEAVVRSSGEISVYADVSSFFASKWKKST